VKLEKKKAGQTRSTS